MVSPGACDTSPGNMPRGRATSWPNADACETSICRWRGADEGYGADNPMYFDREDSRIVASPRDQPWIYARSVLGKFTVIPSAPASTTWGISTSSTTPQARTTKPSACRRRTKAGVMLSLSDRSG